MSAAPVAALEDPVEAGREGLNRQSTGRSFPWYDKEADAPRRVEMRASQSFLPPGLGAMIMLLSWGLAIALVVLIVYLLVKNVVFDQQPASEEAPHVGGASEIDRIDDLPFPIRRPVGDLLAEARRQYELGNYGEAMVYLYSHLLVTLDRAQLIRLTKGKTNRQYLREIARLRSLSVILSGAMVAFEDFFFGRHPVDRERFEQSWRRLDEFTRLVERGAEA
ncbi:MAG: DUF4129 domain-containing protein [Pirellulales bacterium]